MTSPEVAAVAADLAPSGTLRASINLGNPVLAHGTPEEPGGVTVDLARALGERLGLPVDLLCFDAARRSLEAMQDGRADLCFLAVDPARAETVAFTAPYVLIEGVYVVPVDSPLAGADEVDHAGVRVGVKQGSAYDLHLTRALEHAEIVRGAEGTTVYVEESLEVGAGIRQPVTAFVADHPGHRLLEPAFMQIEQAVGTTQTRTAATVDFLRTYVEEQKANGFVADALARAGRADTQVAPPG
ncbi:transporter substrate-binding domain-containing protein [Nocardioides sp. AX2bis]|uniref:transporter substrate-binding domain-containing protein n=1 Tax=Nocardioides sp. AX2bis TaxID=2653157 RepID=UPI0012F3BE82|nr:transporter substrate-binding domain-containing protein [Nocardioides sp. AX2bis]VXB92084.1 Bacterial extracellular solute-binding protein, family 3 [Nocardioides sp. AX2bis]